MGPILKEFLRPVIQSYDELKSRKDLLAADAEKYRTYCLSGIAARMEVLPDNDPEYKECAFISQALKNGWLVSDIESLSTLYTTVQGLPAALKPYGNKVIEQYASVKIDTLADRFDMLKLTNKFWIDIKREYAKDYKELMQEETRKINKRLVVPSEYPQDKDFSRFAGSKDPADGLSYAEMDNDIDLSIAFDAMRAERARENDAYVFDELRENTIQTNKAREFVPNPGQRYNKITKSASKAISEVFGDSVYDDIYEMNRGDLSTRRVKLHHSLGTKRQKEGYDVLEMEFAGSGGQDVLRPYKDRNGVIDKSLSPEKIKKRYGTQAQKPDGTPFDYIYYKSKTVEMPDGSSATKLRYTFPGPTPDLKYLRGIPNMGEYSIENSREYARRFAEDFLKPRFEEWIKGGKPKPIHVDLSGHSRGAVTAGQAAKLIDKWIQKYIEKHPDPKVKAMDLKQYVHYDLRLLDPVPGAITNMHLGSCDLTKIRNMNCVVFCSMGIQAPDMLYPLQHVKGAKKVILTMTGHEMDQSKTDVSQETSFGDGKYHALGYYDAETGEVHRGSGLNELPDGVYVSDENHALIRITSYSQANELFGKVYDKSSPQRIRARRIHKMVRDWFIENELETSFPDEQARRTEEAKNKATQKKILQVNTRRIRFVKAELKALNELKKRPHTKQELLDQNNKLIKACRDYMKDTTMPPKGVTAYKVGLVADTLSYTMRENNCLKKEIRIEKGEQPEPDLDDKIREHKKLLEKKPGYYERKIAEETKRLEHEMKVLKLIADVKLKCRETLDTLDQTRIGESNSSSYEKLHKVLTDGSKLGNETSVNDMTEFFRQLAEASKSYSKSHDILGGPITFDGITRLNESNEMNRFGKEAGEKLEKLTAGMNEKNTPLGIRAADRNVRIEQMKTRQAELKNAQNGPAAEAGARPAQPVMAL